MRCRFTAFTNNYVMICWNTYLIICGSIFSQKFLVNVTFLIALKRKMLQITVILIYGSGALINLAEVGRNYDKTSFLLCLMPLYGNLNDLTKTINNLRGFYKISKTSMTKYLAPWLRLWCLLKMNVLK